MIYKRNIIQTEELCLFNIISTLLTSRHKKPPRSSVDDRGGDFSPIQSNSINGEEEPRRAFGDPCPF